MKNRDFLGGTCCMLKKNEIKQFGEYRTRRLVLEAWDAQHARRRNDKAVPGLKKMKNKIAGKEEKTDEEPETVEEGEVL